MQPMKKLILVAFLLLQSAAGGAASAGDAAGRSAPSAAQDHARIRNTVTQFVEQQTAALPGKATYQIDEIDRRIALPPCANFEAFLPPGSQLIGKTSVGVRCAPSSRQEETQEKNQEKNMAGQTRTNDSRTNGWSIFVPVQIRVSLNLLTSARQLPPGHTLQEHDLASQTTEASRTEGFTDPQQVLGKVLRYGISAGQVLREDMLRQPYSVKQGQVVQIAVQGNGFSIRSEGVALNNAGEGQAVQIRVSSGRVVSGVARAGGLVEIAP